MSEENKNTNQDFSLIENFVNALTIEVEETKKKNVEKEIVLENGERGEAVGSKFIYRKLINYDFLLWIY